MSKSKLIYGAAILSSAVILSGCGSSSSSSDKATNDAPPSGSTGSPVILSGTAAVGAPLVQQTINLLCGDGQLTSVTNAQGDYSITQDEFDAAAASFPCVLNVLADKDKLYSMAFEKGITNITPFTTLALSSALSAAAGYELDDWYTSLQDKTNNLDLTSLQAQLTQAIEGLSKDLETAQTDDTNKVDFNFFTTAFTADSLSNYDVWLDKFADALKEAQKPFNDFLSIYSAGNGLQLSLDLNKLPDTQLPDGTPLPDISGNSTLVLNVKVGGVDAGEVITINNIPKPANESEFCQSDIVENQLIDALQVDSCTFDGSRGVIKGKILMDNIPGMPSGLPLNSLDYEYTYQYQ